MADGYPTTALEPRSPDSKVPPWISVFILFGALGVLILLFVLACWFARSFLAHAGSSRWPNPAFIEPIPESEEVVAQKMRQLDENAPVKTLGAWKAESSKGDAKQAAQATSVLVCAICLDVLEDADLIRELRCHHVYHSECIVKWYMKRHDTCPLCKNYYVPHQEVVITIPPEALRRGGRTARDEALLRYYQTVVV